MVIDMASIMINKMLNNFNFKVFSKVTYIGGKGKTHCHALVRP